MTPQQYEHLTELFHAALEIAPDERGVFLDQVTDGDADLLRELESLLAAHEQRVAHTEKPPDDIAAGLNQAQQDCGSDNVKSLAPNTRLDRYEIHSLLGKGGMGEVYLAEDMRLHRMVALKILPAAIAANQDRMRRFKQEAHAAAALSHPYIAQIFEIGESDGTNFIAMELVDGVTLREKIHKERTDLTKLLKYLQQVAEGLAKAHAAGIVHRDLKPDNIMINRDGYAKILDFGLAKLIEPQKPLGSAVSSEVSTAIMAQHSLSGMVMGTTGYMSPEQAQGKVKEIDQRSDIFSFGCVLFEAVTRQRPFADESFIKSLHKIVCESLPPIKDFNPSAPPDLQRIVRRCLEKDPDERYQTIKDVVLELNEVRQGMTGVRQLDTSGSGTQTATIAVRQRGEITRHWRRAVIAAATLFLVFAPLIYLFYFATSSKVIDSIAVLPLVNAGNDPETEYLSDGITESLINSLSRFSQLRVPARTTAFHYKGKEIDPLQVGRELGVQAILTGKLIQRGDTMILQVELVETSTGSQVWGEQYNRKASDLLAVKQELARDITERLRSKFGGEDEKRLTRGDPGNTEAYKLYLKGRHFWNSRTTANIKKAMEQFQLAIFKDQNYALAYVGLADCYSALERYGGTPSGETLPMARAAVMRALQIDDSLAEAHASLGMIEQYSWNFSEAEREHKRAIELNPNYAHGHFLYSFYFRVRGKFDEAMAESKRAQQLDPLSPIIGISVAQLHTKKGELDVAIEAAMKALELDPAFAETHRTLGVVYRKQGRYDLAIVELEKSLELSGRQSFNLADLGVCYAVAGKKASARAILHELEEKYDKHEALGQNLADVSAALSEKEQAFAWLEKDFQARSGFLPVIAYGGERSDIMREKLSSDPRWNDLQRRIGLPQN